MDTRELADCLVALIGYRESIDNLNLDDARVRTFEEAGLLTHDDGVVVRLPDGSEFQITVTQSR